MTGETPPPPTPPGPRATFITGVAVLGAIGLVITVAAFFLLGAVTDGEELRRLTTEAGPWGPIVFMAIQFVQVVIFPLPGQVSGLAAGYLFGATLGTIYATVGGTLGFTAVFLLGRWLGRPFVEKVISRKSLDAFDHFSAERGVLGFFIVFLLPVFPDDVIAYVAGLTRIPIPTLVVTVLAGRFPFYLALALIGAGVAESDVVLLTAISVVCALVVGVSLWKRKEIEAFVKRRRAAQPPQTTTSEPPS